MRQSPPPAVRLATVWDDALCDFLDGDDLSDEDPEALLLQRQSYYLGAFAALVCLRNGASREALQEEIAAVFPDPPGE